MDKFRIVRLQIGTSFPFGYDVGQPKLVEGKVDYHLDRYKEREHKISPYTMGLILGLIEAEIAEQIEEVDRLEDVGGLVTSLDAVKEDPATSASPGYVGIDDVHAVEANITPPDLADDEPL